MIGSFVEVCGHFALAEKASRRPLADGAGRFLELIVAL
jgi:hypothetical protein